MTLTLNGISALEARIAKAHKQMPTITGDTSKEAFAKTAIEYYLDVLKKKKIIT